MKESSMGSTATDHFVREINGPHMIGSGIRHAFAPNPDPIEDQLHRMHAAILFTLSRGETMTLANVPGFPRKHRHAGLALSETGARAWRTGVRWTLGLGVAFGIEGTRGEPANDDPPEHGLAFRATLRW